MQTAEQIISAIEAEAKSHKPDVRRVATMNPGEVARQGDIYCTMLKEAPKGLKTIQQRQLAPGNTKGSRHIIAASVDCEVLGAPKGADALTGPVIVSKDRLLVEHPEHGHLDLPAGCYQVTYQRDYAKERADEIRRVMD